MSKKMIALSAFAAVALAGGIASAASFPKKDTPLKAVGKPVNCVTVTRIQQTRVVDDNTIDFMLAGNKLMRNTLPSSCPTLKSEERFSYRVNTGQLCSVDIVYVLQDWGGRLQEGAGCGLGKFQQMEPVTPVKK